VAGETCDVNALTIASICDEPERWFSENAV